MPDTWQDATPTAYGREYTARAVRYWNDAVGAAIRRHGPAFLRVPPELLVAFVAPGFASSNTTEGSGSAAQSVAFHELGLFQVPAGPRDGPAPNPDPRADHSAWARLAQSPDVVHALGRPGTTSTTAWRTAIEDQVVIGLANLRDDYRAAVNRLPAALRPAHEGTRWGSLVLFMAFSSGAAGASALLSEYAGALAGRREDERPRALAYAMAAAVARGVAMGGSAGRHSNKAHRLVRTWQKFEVARQLARALGRSEAPFDWGVGADQPALEALLARGSLNLAADRAAPPDPGPSSRGAWLGAAALVAAVALVVVASD